MGVSGVNPKSNFYSSFFARQTQSETNQQARAAKAALGKLQAELKTNQNSAYLSSIGITPNKTVSLQLPASANVSIPTPPAEAEGKPKSRYEAPEANNASSTRNTTTVNVEAGKNNKATGPTGWSSYGNSVNVSGANNNVNIAGKSKITSEIEAAATGGTAIRSNSVAVNGTGNSVLFSGERIANSQIDVAGKGNSVEVGSGVNNAKVNVTADNVKVTISDNDLLKKGNNDWKIDVGVSDVEVKIQNGVAQVSGAGADAAGVSVEIDNETRTVTVKKS